MDTASISETATATLAQTLANDRAHQLAKNAVTSVGIRKAARNAEAVAQATTVFDIQLEQGDPTDQKRSGRCWMFASLNTMRYRIMKKLGLKTFELSQAYPLFWDKYERCNWFFENIIATVSKPLDGRELAFLLTDPLCDGGQWDMFRSLVKKYGVVPKEAMPETHASSNTGDLNKYLTRYLRSSARRLRDSATAGATQSDLRELKEELMADVYRVLSVCLGEPPKSFELRVRDDKNELKAEGTYTPQEFFATFVDMDLDDYISVINSPTHDKPYLHSYTVKYLGNLVEDGGVRYVNLPIEALKRAAIAQMKDGLPVWFGCDVDQGFLSDDGVLDQHALDIDALFDVPIEAGIDKAARLDYGESLMTHAMTLVGVNLDADGKPTRWRVENSWGSDHGKKGYDIASDAWFDEYVYQVVVDRKYLSDEELRAYDSEPIELAPWDPMGALAR
ncbi:C1 family peptidase [Collinsella sp. AGMB00827]|uniref:Aminopeptidase n=1 Tax=Collinsella ureilytica TaxID=2869515 RepID=A0ABS7MIE8_9ACTN|nr:C1 family peptidase [Collinsella urealyticum]MBY4796866.1 C1 family peptidase [Collinsella urealyticum]